jgi:hypothetical protein
VRRRDILDLSSPLNDAAAALVDDSFLRCFKSAPDEPWNWNLYLFPLWALGVVVRNFVLFPLRWVLAWWALGWLGGCWLLVGAGLVGAGFAGAGLAGAGLAGAGLAGAVGDSLVGAEAVW